MKTRFTTEHNSVFEIDYQERTWKHISSGHDNEKRGLRTTEGAYIEISPINLGDRVQLWCEPFVEGAAARLISTSPVVSFEVVF
jgi:hypothetical protein